MQLISSAFQTLERRVLAKDVFGLHEQYKASRHIQVNQRVSKVFGYINYHSIDLISNSPQAAEDLKNRAMRLALKLSTVEEFQNPKWKLHSVTVNNCLGVTGVLARFEHEDGMRCEIGTTRTSEQIRRETTAGIDWVHRPDQPEPWMAE